MAETKLDTVTLGAGCFWCVETIFAELKGVTSVQSGYAGGTTIKPTYKEVCTGETGHAEACQITFDPQILSFEELLEVFWNVHDPTTLNRQGADVGTQYRSVIFYHTDDQRRIAETSRKKWDESGTFKQSIVTEIEPFDMFFEAEDYHQDYFNNNPNVPYCSFVISPKVEKFRKNFDTYLKK
ncbi:MAG: peptide-methionine (S)-S-oxide reductase MsrA [Bacteroidales bacterium]|nr:peptide-methionine (S)-S-oxide reductase MsrA [Bacteroidales bacterium]